MLRLLIAHWRNIAFVALIGVGVFFLTDAYIPGVSGRPPGPGLFGGPDAIGPSIDPFPAAFGAASLALAYVMRR